MNTSQKSIVIWLLAGCLLIWAMVVVGGITRLTGSGLSMAKWKIATVVPPLNDAQWQAEFNDYKQTPQYKEVNSYFTLDDYKHIYWWEFIHRLIGRMIGMVFLIPFVFFVYKKWLTGVLLWKSIIIFCLGGLQGVVGWYMVASGLQDVPHVSHYFLAAHLITAFITFGFTFWVALDIIYPRSPLTIHHSALNIRRWSYVLLLDVLIQIKYGAFTSGLHAGQFDPTWPKMGNSWIAPEVTSMTPWWRNFIDGIAGVQFVHRYNAYLVVILVFIIWFKSRKMQLLPTQRKGIYFLVAMVCVQFLLGVFTLVYSVPIVLGVLHQTGAFLLFMSVLFITHQWSVAEPVASKI